MRSVSVVVVGVDNPGPQGVGEVNRLNNVQVIVGDTGVEDVDVNVYLTRSVARGRRAGITTYVRDAPGNLLADVTIQRGRDGRANTEVGLEPLNGRICLHG